MSKYFVTVRFSFDSLGKVNLETDSKSFGYHVQAPRSLTAEVIGFSPEFEDAKANVGKTNGTMWINVKTAEPKIAAKRSKAKAKAEAPMAAAPEVDPALIAAILAALGKK